MERPKPNWSLLTMSLFLSLLLWAIVFPQTAPDQATRVLPIVVQFEGLPSTLTVTSYDEVLDMTAVGAQTKINQIDPKRITAVVSLSDAKPGKKRYPVTVSPPQYQDYFPNRSYTASFNIEPIATRTLSVEVNTVGQLPDPTIALEDTLVEPTTVTVSGPQSVVEKLTKARATFDLTTVDVLNKTSQTPAVELVNADGSVPEGVALEVQPKLVRITPILASAPQQKPVFVSPNIQGSPAEGFVAAGYEITPTQILLKGSSRALAAVTQIATDAINLAGVKQTTDFIVNLRVPQGLAADKRRVTVRVIVKPVAPPSGGTTGGTSSPPTTTTTGQ